MGALTRALAVMLFKNRAECVGESSPLTDMLVDLMELEAIVALKLGVASSHRVRSFQQIITKETVAGLSPAPSRST